MFKVELSLNGDFVDSYECEAIVTVKEIISRHSLSGLDTIIFKLNNEFVNSNKIIAEDAVLDCIGFNSEEGFRIYQDSAIFIMAKVFHELFDRRWNLIVKHSIGDGIYCEAEGEEIFLEQHLDILRKEFARNVSRELYIERVEMTVDDATNIFQQQGRDDIIKNFQFNQTGYTVVFRCGDYYDYYIRQLSDNTGIISEYDLNYISPGFCIRFPLISTRQVKPVFNYPRKLFNIHQEADRWLNILDIRNIGDLNKKVKSNNISEDIQIEEALHEKKLVAFTDEISARKDVKVILVAGPSSSGKTTFSKRLSIQLQVNGIKPIILGLDEYFHPREITPRKENGEFDFESIRAIDLELFNNHLKSLLEDKTIELPKYDFVSGTRKKSNQNLKMEANNVLLIEGIHALSDELTKAVPAQKKVKIYISCLNQLNIDRHNRIATTYFRKIRRLVRDNYFRGYSAEMTLKRWSHISEGEHLNIFPFQEEADLIFNSGLTYEINVFKKHALPMLYRISKFSNVFTEAQKIIWLIEHALDIPDDLVPTNSILREFIGGGIFKY